MKFKYSARNKEGELQVGIVEAANREGAISILNNNSLFVLSVESAEKRGLIDILASFFNRVRTKDIVIMSRQLATLLEAKIALTDSLKNLHTQTDNSVLREIIFQIMNDVSAGVSFSQAIARHPSVFSDFFVNMIRSAEITGRVDEAMSYMADYMEAQEALTSRVKNALIYPAFVVGLFFVVVVVMVVYVFPQLKPIFEDGGVELPIYTQAVLGLGDFIIAWWWAMAAILIIVFMVMLDYLKTEEGQAFLHDTLIRVPVLGKMFRNIYVSRFAQSTSVLIKGGISIVQAIRISAHTIGNVLYAEEIDRIADRVKEGDLLSKTLAKSSFFPPMVSNLVAVGESTGRVDDLLDKVSSFYTREVDNLVSNLVELIQPILMVVIAVFVGVLFASILMPIYNLAQTF